MYKSTRASGIGDCVAVAAAAENRQRSRRGAAAAACRQWLWQRSTGQQDDGGPQPPQPQQWKGAGGEVAPTREQGRTPRAQRAVTANGPRRSASDGYGTYIYIL